MLQYIIEDYLKKNINKYKYMLNNLCKGLKYKYYKTINIDFHINQILETWQFKL